MTNQVNQAFEKWFESQYNHKPKENNGVYMTMFADGASKGYQAATKASESEINSLKQRVEELQASINDLNDALYVAFSYCPDDESFDYIETLLAITPAQSLTEKEK